MKIILLYSGLKVQVKDPDKNLSGSLINSYKTLGCLYITDVLYDDKVILSYSPKGAITVTINNDLIAPIYDKDLLSVLYEKQDEIDKLKWEIYDIKNFMGNRCKEG